MLAGGRLQLVEEGWLYLPKHPHPGVFLLCSKSSAVIPAQAEIHSDAPVFGN